jgi:hypothetical protein
VPFIRILSDLPDSSGLHFLDDCVELLNVEVTACIYIYIYNLSVGMWRAVVTIAFSTHTLVIQTGGIEGGGTLLWEMKYITQRSKKSSQKY